MTDNTLSSLLKQHKSLESPHGVYVRLWATAETDSKWITVQTESDSCTKLVLSHSTHTHLSRYLSSAVKVYPSIPHLAIHLRSLLSLYLYRINNGPALVGLACSRALRSMSTSQNGHALFIYLMVHPSFLYLFLLDWMRSSVLSASSSPTYSLSFGGTPCIINLTNGSLSVALP